MSERVYVRVHGLNYNTVRSRIQKGQTILAAVNPSKFPVKKRTRHAVA